MKKDFDVVQIVLDLLLIGSLLYMWFIGAPKMLNYSCEILATGISETFLSTAYSFSELQTMVDSKIISAEDQDNMVVIFFENGTQISCHSEITESHLIRMVEINSEDKWILEHLSDIIFCVYPDLDTSKCDEMAYYINNNGTYSHNYSEYTSYSGNYQNGKLQLKLMEQWTR